MPSAPVRVRGPLAATRTVGAPRGCRDRRLAAHPLAARGFFPAHVRRELVRHALVPLDGTRPPAPAPSLGTIGYLGALDVSKGVDALLDALPRLGALGLTVRVAGDGRLREAVSAAAGGSDRVHYHGVVAGAAKESFVSECDAAIVPSRWEEPEHRRTRRPNGLPPVARCSPRTAVDWAKLPRSYRESCRSRRRRMASSTPCSRSESRSAGERPWQPPPSRWARPTTSVGGSTITCASIAGRWVRRDRHPLPPVARSRRRAGYAEASLSLASVLRDQGVRTVLCTPHLSRRYPTRGDDAERAARALRAELTRRGIALDLQVAAELADEVAVRAPLEELRRRSVSGRYLLVEVQPATPAGFFALVTTRIGRAGLLPIFAHPERSRAVQRDVHALDDVFARGARSCKRSPRASSAVGAARSRRRCGRCSRATGSI